MKHSKVKSRTDWKQVRSRPEGAPVPYDPADGPYDPNDEAAVEAYWSQSDILRKGKVIRKGRGPQKTPIKKRITIRLSPEVVEHFRSIGKGWQAKMDDVLKRHVKRQPKRDPRRQRRSA